MTRRLRPCRVAGKAAWKVNDRAKSSRLSSKLPAGLVPARMGGHRRALACTLKMEKCSGGMKIMCSCDDKMACSMMQNLCKMLAGGMCSCSMMMNGMMVCSCNLTMGMCKCDMTKDGVSISCTSGDPKCCEMIQACCECMACMLENGCTCCVMMNGTPICCGCC